MIDIQKLDFSELRKSGTKSDRFEKLQINSENVLWSNVYLLKIIIVSQSNMLIKKKKTICNSHRWNNHFQSLNNQRVPITHTSDT